MTDKKLHDENLESDQAIQAVLEAERASLDAIAKCEHYEAERLERARQTAHRIARRTDYRITRLHSRFERVLADRIRQLEHAYQLLDTGTDYDEPDQTLLTDVISKIADRLVKPQKADTGSG